MTDINATQADIENFIEKLTQQTETNKEEGCIRFEDSMALIEAHYEFTPSAFTNGKQVNAAGENSGSCKLFSFAQIHQLTQSQSLRLFGQYYFDVLDTPDGSDHQNIRQFIINGWPGICFPQLALASK
ncbi:MULTISPECIES: HopJ type III effector protein [unclassified Shewanella]|uniref:HopJ type III effector protein n=1 Tax=unclassified Shewanella TaxID=196818 RepID=UPI0035529BAC